MKYKIYQIVGWLYFKDLPIWIEDILCRIRYSNYFKEFWMGK